MHVVTVASAVVFARVLILIATVAPREFGQLAPPLAIMLGALGVITLGLWFFSRHEPVEMPTHGNPTQLKPAIGFGLLFAAVLFATAAAREFFGTQGLYAVAALSGLTDMDAITLSTAQLVHKGQLEPATGWRLILTASMSNLVFKAGVAAVLGNAQIARRTGVVFAFAFALGAALLWLWPV